MSPRSQSTAAHNAPSRRRNRRAHRAILDATLELLRTARYSALTIEAITSRAGVGKATVYRWWPSKGALVAEAISTTMTVDLPSATGDLTEDLVAAVEVSIANYAHTSSGALIAALAADLAEDPELVKSLLDRFVLIRRSVVAELIEKAIGEGMMPERTDPEVIMDMWAGALFYLNLLRHRAISDDLATLLVDAVTTPSARTNTAAGEDGGRPDRLG